MRKKAKALRFLSFVFVLVLLAATLPASVFAETNKEKLERLKGELAEISANIAEAEKNLSNAQSLLSQYQQEAAVIEQLLEANRISIAETQSQIADKQEEISQKRQTIYENQELFEERLVAIYKMNNAGVLSTLLNVNSYSEMLGVSNALQTISQHDTDLLNLLASERDQMERELAELDLLLAELNDKQTELDNLAATYANNISKQNQAISAAEAARIANEAAYGATYEEYEKALEEERKTATTINNTGSNSSDGSQYEGGAFTWPVNGYYNVSCEYGSPDPNGNGHRGMDIAGGGIGGAAIGACADGRVIIATSGHYSYGNYVVVDHGGGLKTLYAHCSSLAVNVNDYVSAGQTIGYVGSTGFSTGNHLHLEVHLNGALQNPRNYFG